MQISRICETCLLCVVRWVLQYYTLNSSPVLRRFPAARSVMGEAAERMMGPEGLAAWIMNTSRHQLTRSLFR